MEGPVILQFGHLCSRIPPPLATVIQRSSSLGLYHNAKAAAREGAWRGIFLILFLGRAGDTFPVLLRFAHTWLHPIPRLTTPLCSQAWAGHPLQPDHAGLLTIQRGWCRVIQTASSPQGRQCTASKICFLTSSLGTRAEPLLGIEIKSSKGWCWRGLQKRKFISQLHF